MGLLPRLHLFEFHDMVWTPTFLRHYFTDMLRPLWSFPLPLERLVAPVLASAVKKANATEILDLCSGAGGPLPAVAREMQRQGLLRDVKIRLSDLYPNIAAWRQVQRSYPDVTIEPCEDPVDATACAQPGFRTVFGAFHHFPEDLARKVLQDAVDANSGIAIFEGTARTLLNVLLFYPLLIPVFIVPLMLFFVRPFRWARVALTLLFPVLPLMFAWDGTVSCLRTWTPSEMEAIIRTVTGQERFEWQTGVLKPWLLPAPRVVYYIGIPKQPKKED